MSNQLVNLQVRDRRQWRAWLEKHHASSPGIWLVFHKGHTQVPSVAYEDSVCEALCFGWIDSLIKRLDEDRYARKFTPRRPTSKWSDLNRKRWAELHGAGLLMPAGLAAAPTENRYAAPPASPAVPGYIAQAVKTNAKAWEFFERMAPSYRRNMVAWIDSAKREETKERRLREAIGLLAAGKKLELK